MTPFPTSADHSFDTIQYLLTLALLLGFLVAGMAALIQCRVVWLHSWLKIGWLGDWLLTRDPRQKLFILRHMVGLANCLAGVAALNYGVRLGAVDPDGCRWLTATALFVMAAFYAVMRSGLNLRFKDPSLLEPQVCSAVLFLAWGYYLGGPCRPVALILLCVVLMFSIFTTTPRSLLRACIISTLAFGSVMLALALRDAQVRYAPQTELVYFCVLLTVQVSVYLLIHQLTRLRAKSTRRKEELAQALERIQTLATRDELTGLFNRRHMLEQLNTEKHRSNRSGRTFCVALIDVDHFKQVNDVHGHGVGDQVLCSVALALTAGLRETDVVARWGGEEFLVMFTDTDCGTAETVLTRIQCALSFAVVCQGVPDLRVTFSAGVTRYEPDEMLTRTIDRADRGLYTAKASGRNRTVRVEPEAAMPQRFEKIAQA